ncbi:MaoC/PaaZ C-terminal domain-containing protein [Streptomyces carpinensis]|uniref:MaoC/PaaZ C-terminal domain-containing protein n=1 Tax=Streptomyces carpinensis TaxID=66369 RepID=A0ABV1W2K5_9ACTN|nr:MaoC/PaaZ C-terminal domain-containing protein [Streptomyces carpinensis]
MALNLDLVGKEWEGAGRRWTSTDTILYALGVGAGAEDPSAELAFTTENSHDVAQQVLPTFAVMLGGRAAMPPLGDFDISQVLHAEQSVTLHGPLPVEGASRIRSRVVGFYDKGPNAIAVIEGTVTDADSGALLAEVRSGTFIRGEGGFGGERGPATPWERPERAPDHTVTYRTRPDQALLYRLSGDRNPLHSDPWLADKAGFDRPILHGLCSYGFTGRALLHTVCDSDPARFGSMSVRFASPVLPGAELSVLIWEDGDTCRFQTTAAGTVVLDRGVFTKRV